MEPDVPTQEQPAFPTEPERALHAAALGLLLGAALALAARVYAGSR